MKSEWKVSERPGENQGDSKEMRWDGFTVERGEVTLLLKE